MLLSNHLLSFLPATAAVLFSATAAALPPPGYNTELFNLRFHDFPNGWIINLGTQYEGGPASWGTGEVERYTNMGTNIRNTESGSLLITPTRNPENGEWTSGRVESTPEHDVTCAPGHKLWVEARLRVGRAAPDVSSGIWHAFWLLGTPFRQNRGSWPTIGELDVMEHPNGLDSVWQTVHCGSAMGGPCSEPVGKGAESPLKLGEFQSFAVEIDRTNEDWREQSVRFLVDGMQRAKITGAQVGSEVDWKPVVGNPKMMFFNVAVGGGFPNAIAGHHTPDSKTAGGEGASMEVESVVAYHT